MPLIHLFGHRNGHSMCLFISLLALLCHGAVALLPDNDLLSFKSVCGCPVNTIADEETNVQYPASRCTSIEMGSKTP